jgi:hypothetical protein
MMVMERQREESKAKEKKITSSFTIRFLLCLSLLCLSLSPRVKRLD